MNSWDEVERLTKQKKRKRKKCGNNIQHLQYPHQLPKNADQSRKNELSFIRERHVYHGPDRRGDTMCEHRTNFWGWSRNRYKQECLVRKY